MQFSLTAVVLAISTLAAAAPHENVPARSSNGLRGQDSDHIRWHVPHGMTVKEAQSKCGDQAQLSCCNKATYAGDTTDVNSGLAGGVLSNLIGSGSGADGAGIFDQCSKLDIQSMHISALHWLITLLILHQSPSSLPSPSRTWSTRGASRTWPAVPTLPPPPATTLSALGFLALPSAPSSKLSAFGSWSFGSWEVLDVLSYTFVVVSLLCFVRLDYSCDTIIEVIVSPPNT